MKYIGICPSSAGLMAAKPIEVEASSVSQALVLIRREIAGLGSRYVSRIVTPQHKTVWEEHASGGEAAQDRLRQDVLNWLALEYAGQEGIYPYQASEVIVSEFGISMETAAQFVLEYVKAEAGHARQEENESD